MIPERLPLQAVLRMFQGVNTGTVIDADVTFTLKITNMLWILDKVLLWKKDHVLKIIRYWDTMEQLESCDSTGSIVKKFYISTLKWQKKISQTFIAMHE